MVNQKNLKRTTLAVAAIATLAGANLAFAANLASTDGSDGTGISLQSVPTIEASESTTVGYLDAGYLSYVLGTEYALNDSAPTTLKFQISNCSWNSTGTYDLENVDGDAAAVLGGEDGGVFSQVLVNDSLLYIGLNYGATSGATYTLTDAGSDDGPTVKVSALDTANESCSVTVTAYRSVLGNYEAFDTSGTLTATMATAYSQFSAAVTTQLDAVIDVEEDRIKFVGGGTTDTATVEIRSDVNTPPKIDAGGVALDASDLVSIRLTGDDFAGIVTVEEVGGSAWTLSTATDSASYTYNGSSTSLGVTMDGIGADIATKEIKVTVDGTQTLDPVDFGITAILDFPATRSVSDMTLLDGAAAGGWDLNGMQAKVPYFLLNDSSVKNFIKVVNETDSDAEITVDAIIQDVTAGSAQTPAEALPLLNSSGASLVAAASGVTNIGSSDLITTLGLGTNKYLVGLTFTVNGPADSIHMTAHSYTGSGRENLTVLYPTDIDDTAYGTSTRGWRQ